MTSKLESVIWYHLDLITKMGPQIGILNTDHKTGTGKFGSQNRDLKIGTTKLGIQNWECEIGNAKWDHKIGTLNLKCKMGPLKYI